MLHVHVGRYDWSGSIPFINSVTTRGVVKFVNLIPRPEEAMDGWYVILSTGVHIREMYIT